MFTGEERARIRSTRSFDNLLDQIKDSLGLLGKVHMSRDGDRRRFRYSSGPAHLVRLGNRGRGLGRIAQE